MAILIFRKKTRLAEDVNDSKITNISHTSTSLSGGKVLKIAE